MAEGRIRFIFVTVGVLFLAIAGQLYRLQVIQAENYHEQAERLRRDTAAVRPRRGTIFDRDGLVLAQDITRFDIDLILPDAENAKGGLPAVLESLSRISSAELTTLEKRVDQIKAQEERRFDRETRWLVRRNLLAANGSSRRAEQEKGLRRRLRKQPHWLLKNAALDTRDRVSVGEFPGLIVTPRPQRVYPRGPLAAHLLGYLGELEPLEYDRRGIDDFFRQRLAPAMNETTFKELADDAQFQSSQYGVAGLEKQYDRRLLGTYGIVVRQKTRTGKMTAMAIEPQAGQDLNLTLDARLQQLAEDALATRGTPGAVVALDPSNGELLALASWPTFNPNDRSSLAGGPNAPTLCRAIAGTYPPGSTIKPLDAAAALEEWADFSNRHYTCNGVFELGGTHKRCLGIHGPIAVSDALKRSCNIFFYQTGLDLMHAPNDLHHWFRAFGIGSVTGIDLPGEKCGLLPTPHYAGDVANHAIGQAFTTTPLRMATVVAALVNGGYRVQPHLRQGASGSPISLGLHPDTLATVQDGMDRVVNESGGTAYKAFSGAQLNGARAGGKTGSAETGRAGEKTHAWFIGYGLRQDKTIAVVVLIERAGHGGSEAAPIARSLMEKYFEARP